MPPPSNLIDEACRKYMEHTLLPLWPTGMSVRQDTWINEYMESKSRSQTRALRRAKSRATRHRLIHRDIMSDVNYLEKCL